MPGQAALPHRDELDQTLPAADEGTGDFVDEETRTSWAIAGIATAGPLKGRRLTMLDHEHTYWFIWSAFRPDTAVRN